MDSIQALRTTLIAFAVSLAIGSVLPDATLAIGEDPAPNATLVAAIEPAEAAPALMLKDALVLEEREGYNSEYIFGMTKAILNSTVHPALKPAVCIVTVPLDLVLRHFRAPVRTYCD